MKKAWLLGSAENRFFLGLKEQKPEYDAGVWFGESYLLRMSKEEIEACGCTKKLLKPGKARRVRLTIK